MSEWKRKHAEFKNGSGKGIGIGCYNLISGGVFNRFRTQLALTNTEIRAFDDWIVHLLTPTSDIGQGSETALKNILSEDLGL